MSTERDTHFMGWAKSLMSDLNTLGFDENGYRSGEEKQKIIARAGYDLVVHSFVKSRYYNALRDIYHQEEPLIEEAQKAITYIPDMAEWLLEPEEN